MMYLLKWLQRAKKEDNNAQEPSAKIGLRVFFVFCFSKELKLCPSNR